MPNAMEQIVRPFQIGEVFTARRPVPQPQPLLPDIESVTVSWGRGGGTSYIQYSNGGIAEAEIVWTEKSSVKEIVRIENPDDPEQYVEIERYNSVTLANQKGQEIRWDLNRGGT
jgi:hypothetical protein